MANIIEIKRHQQGDDDRGTIYYFIKLDTTPANWVEVLALVGIPAKDDKLGNTGFYVANRSVEQDKDDPRIWTAIVYYEKSPAVSITGTTDRLISFEMDSVGYDIVAEKAYNAVMEEVDNVNAANDPFDPPVVVTVYNRLLRFTQKETTLFKPNLAIRTQGHLNAAPLTVCGERIAQYGGLMRKVKPVLQSNGYYYTTYEIELEDDKPFLRQIANRGYRSLDEVTGYPRAIMLSDINSDYAAGGSLATKDAQVSDPVNLDNDGHISTIGTVYLARYFNTAVSWAGALNLVKRL